VEALALEAALALDRTIGHVLTILALDKVIIEWDNAPKTTRADSLSQQNSMSKVWATRTRAELDETFESSGPSQI